MTIVHTKRARKFLSHTHFNYHKWCFLLYSITAVCIDLAKSSHSQLHDQVARLCVAMYTQSH